MSNKLIAWADFQSKMNIITKQNIKSFAIVKRQSITHYITIGFLQPFIPFNNSYNFSNSCCSNYNLPSSTEFRVISSHPWGFPRFIYLPPLTVNIFLTCPLSFIRDKCPNNPNCHSSIKNNVQPTIPALIFFLWSL